MTPPGSPRLEPSWCPAIRVVERRSVTAACGGASAASGNTLPVPFDQHAPVPEAREAAGGRLRARARAQRHERHPGRVEWRAHPLRIDLARSQALKRARRQITRFARQLETIAGPGPAPESSAVRIAGAKGESRTVIQ